MSIFREVDFLKRGLCDFLPPGRTFVTRLNKVLFLVS